jgi:SAM-dependent methyltransferase
MRIQALLKHPMQNFVYRLVQLVGPRSLPRQKGTVTGPRRLEITRVQSYAAYVCYAQSMVSEYERRQAVEHSLAKREEPFYVSGYCFVCDRESLFLSDYKYAFVNERGDRIPNWRERLVCPGCRMNNRLRASIQVFVQACTPGDGSAIYITEQTTPLFQWMKKRFVHTCGSEFLGDQVPKGSVNISGIRHEDLCHLTFGEAVFDYILSFDVFEHVPEYGEAFKECLRCLRPGGALFFTVPFDLNSERNIIRARVREDGVIEHILPAEYHGDPLRPEGALCFQHFGWNLLEELRTMGFRDAAALFYWSESFGYLGGDQFVFIAWK